MIQPPPPTGSDDEAAWMRWAHQELLSLRPIRVSGVKMGQTQSGVYRIFEQTKTRIPFIGWGLSFWVKIDVRRAFTPFIQFIISDEDLPDHIWFLFNPSDLAGNANATAQDPFREVNGSSFISPISTGDWHFFCFCFRADTNLTMTYSVDGAPKVTLFEAVYMAGFPATAGTPMGALRIQTGVPAIDDPAAPFMSEVVYDEVAIRTAGEFTNDEIAYLYNGGSGRTYPVDPPLAAYWQLDDTTSVDNISGVELAPYHVDAPALIASQAKLGTGSGKIGSGLSIGYGTGIPGADVFWYAGIQSDLVPELGIVGR